MHWTPLFGQIEIVKHVSAGEMLDGDDTLSATLRLETGRQYYDIFGSNVVTEGETHPDQDHMISSDNNDDESNIMGVTDDHQTLDTSQLIGPPEIGDNEQEEFGTKRRTRSI